MEKCLIFNLWGDYAHFRSIYTTSSPLTYPFPPKPAIIGIISSMIGLDKSNYLDLFYKGEFLIALSIVNPVKKIRMTENYCDVKRWSPQKRYKNIIDGKITDMELTHTQIRIEFLKDPKFTVYFYHKDSSIMDRLRDVLNNHNSVYTVTLGLSENIANFSLVEEKEFNTVNDINSSLAIKSVIKKPNIQGNIDFAEGLRVKVVNMPVEMGQDRVVSEYNEFIYEENGKNINTQIKNSIKIDDYYISPI